MFQKMRVLLLSLVAVMLLAACGGGSKDGGEAAPVKDTLVVGQGADAKSLDPHATNDQPSSRVSAQIYDRLVEADLDMNIVPGLAESWEQPDDLTTIFKLREGVKFHNGEELKASDVKFTIDRMLSSPTVHHIIQAVDSVEVVDDYTVKVTTKQPFGALLNHLSHTAASILSEKAVTEMGDNYGQTPVGTGPYAFVKWDAGDKVVLKANDDYFRGAPEIKNVIFRNITEGTNRTIGLETKEVDIAYDIEPIDKGAIIDNPDLTLTEEPSLSMAYIGFNMKKEVFQNAKVREAISHAIKVDDIIEAVLMGAGSPANSPIGPKVFGHNPDVKAPEYDVELAKQLLAEAGYPNGFKTSIWTNDNPVRVQICQIVQAQLKEIGIDMSIEIVEWGAYLDGTSRGDHDMFILGWVTVTGDADYGLYALFHSTTQGGAGNRSFYSNPKVDELLDQAKSSTDPEARRALYGEIQAILQEELPVRTLYYQTHNAGMQNNVEGFHLHPAGHHKIYGVSFKK